MRVGEKLKEFLTERKVNVSWLAGEISISHQALYNKLNGESEFTVSEALRIASVLRMTTDERNDIFFTK